MAEITFDLGSLAAAIEHVRATGEAHLLGDMIGQGLLDRIGRHEILVRHGSAPPDRDQLAAMAMQGLLAGSTEQERNTKGFVAGLIRHSHHVADAMLAERKRQEEPSHG